MKKSAAWARRYPVHARILIVVLHLLLCALAIYTGNALSQLGLVLSPYFFLGGCLLFMSAVLFYPARGTGNTASKQRRFTIRKCCDGAMAICSFSMLCFTVNQLNAGAIPGANALAAVEKPHKDKTDAAGILASLAYRDKSTLTRSEKRVLRTEFRRQLKVYAKAKLMHNEDTAGKAALIVLAILAAVGLTYLLAGLACTLSCNGSEALSIFVLVFGMAAIITLLIVVINKIKKHYRKVTPETNPAPTAS